MLRFLSLLLVLPIAVAAGNDDAAETRTGQRWKRMVLALPESGEIQVRAATDRQSTAYECVLIPGRLKQIDAGAGEVWGVTDSDDIYTWASNDWRNIPGKLIHVSVGPAGVWGVNSDNTVFKRQDNEWLPRSGLMKQIDAGGYKFVSGVGSGENIFCLNQACTLSRSSTVTYAQLDGALKYYTCGPIGCWGVNSANYIFFRHNVSPNNCQGTHWQQVDGTLTMVEVSTDGFVIGIGMDNRVYKREGITGKSPIGTSWTLLDFCGTSKHVTYDSGYLWRLGLNGDIYKCSQIKPNPYYTPQD